MQPLTPPTADVLGRLDRFLGPALLAIPPGRERRLAATYVRGLLGPSERKNAERIARQARGVERDYREGTGLVGLDHFEGRSWRGLHHHAALVVLAQHFLVHERLNALRETPMAPPPTKAPPAAPAAFSP